TEEALATDEPVTVEALHPVLVTSPHVLGVPGELATTSEELLPKGLVPTTVTDVPLAGGDDLQGFVALFVELDRMGDGFGLPDQVSALPKAFDGAHTRGVHRRTDQLVVGLAGRSGLQTGGRVGHDASVPADDRTSLQLQLTPPGDVGGVAEGTDHRDPGTLRSEV